jgi:DNA primase
MELAHLNSLQDQGYDIPKARELLELEGNQIEIRDWEESKFGFAATQHLPDWWLDNFQLATSHPRSLSYLQHRGVSTQIAEVLNLRYDHYRDCVGFPSRDFDQRLVGMRGRLVDLPNESPKDAPRFHDYVYQGKSNSGHVWLGEHLVNLSKPLVICEGNFDYCRIFSLYSNVVSAQTATVSVDKIKRLMGAWHIILFFDNDMAGSRGADKVKRTLGKECVISEVKYPKGFKDPGDMSLEMLADVLQPFGIA